MKSTEIKFIRNIMFFRDIIQIVSQIRIINLNEKYAIEKIWLVVQLNFFY